jgi:hypothetical protein
LIIRGTPINSWVSLFILLRQHPSSFSYNKIIFKKKWFLYYITQLDKDYIEF